MNDIDSQFEYSDQNKCDVDKENIYCNDCHTAKSHNAVSIIKLFMQGLHMLLYSNLKLISANSKTN